MSISITDNLNRTLFNAIPAIALIVDNDVRILDYNKSASKLLGDDIESILKHRGGEALRCIHSLEVPEGCGHTPHCKNCVIRNSVKEAFRGNSVVRRRARLDLVHDDKIDIVFSLITASPFVFDGSRLVLLIIEDIGEIVELQRIIPICMSCKKVRSDEQYWTEVAAYFSTHLDLAFSHGYCPDCAAKEFEKLKHSLDEM